MDPHEAESAPQGDIKFTRQRGFFDRNPLVRVLIAAGFGLFLLAFLHFREVKLALPERDTIADRYVVAQVDFTFLDEELTAYEREQAVRDIGKIYRLSDEQIRERRRAFEAQLSRDDAWRSWGEAISYQDVLESLSQIEESLQKVRFTDARTLNQMHNVKLSTSNYLLLYARGPGEALPLMEQAWDQIREIAFDEEPAHPEAADYIVQYFQTQPWVTEEDVSSQEQLRARVKKQVPNKYSSVKAGSRIINQGDTVTSRHLAQLNAMKRAIAEKRNLWHPITLFGSLLMTLLLMSVAYLHLRSYHKEVLYSNRRLTLVMVTGLMSLGLAKLMEFLLLRTPSHLLEYLGTPIVVPFAAIILCCLLSSNIALMASGFLTVVLSMALALDRGNSFLVLNLAAAVVAILSTRRLSHRKEIFQACVKAWLACLAVLVAMRFYSNQVSGVGLASDIISATFYMGLTGILVVGLLPALESSFGIITDITLMEYMDPNNELLRRLSIEAPGTYQHSVVVGNLSESAALAIGANGLFCRVSTLYHDIGKLTAPHYFTENQQGGMNMHQLLTPLESAQVIMSHVSEGVAMARKAGLPEPFIDIIKEHHGTTLVYYFYHKQCQQSGDTVEASDFRYAGPKPRSKESAIIMIADTLEAASRSLDEVTEESVTALLERLVRDKSDDGQFDECQLTFEELGIVKAAMIKTLLAAGHSRIKYPKRIKPREVEEEEEREHQAS